MKSLFTVVLWTATACASAGSPASPGGACKAGQLNDHGVGKPCVAAEDCHGQLAVTCLQDLGPGAPAMCVEYCFGLPGECGDGAICMPRGDKPSICVPPACAKEFAVLLPNDLTCTACGAPPTVDGFGKPCTTQADCQGQAAQTCPYAIKTSNPPWCSALCSKDSDCGAGAVCWRREVEEYGVKFVIGSCAPAACCTKL